MKDNCQDEPNNPRKEFKQRSEKRKNMDWFLNITKQMKISIIVLALALGSQAFAQESQKSILDFIPSGGEYTMETDWDTTVYTYDVSIIENIEDLTFVEHRLNNLTDAMVYRTGGFQIRVVTPSEDDEVQNGKYLAIYRP